MSQGTQAPRPSGTSPVRTSTTSASSFTTSASSTTSTGDTSPGPAGRGDAKAEPAGEWTGRRVERAPGDAKVPSREQPATGGGHSPLVGATQLHPPPAHATLLGRATLPVELDALPTTRHGARYQGLRAALVTYLANRAHREAEPVDGKAVVGECSLVGRISRLEKGMLVDLQRLEHTLVDYLEQRSFLILRPAPEPEMRRLLAEVRAVLRPPYTGSLEAMLPAPGEESPADEGFDAGSDAGSDAGGEQDLDDPPEAAAFVTTTRPHAPDAGDSGDDATDLAPAVDSPDEAGYLSPLNPANGLVSSIVTWHLPQLEAGNSLAQIQSSLRSTNDAALVDSGSATPAQGPALSGQGTGRAGGSRSDSDADRISE